MYEPLDSDPKHAENPEHDEIQIEATKTLAKDGRKWVFYDGYADPDTDEYIITDLSCVVDLNHKV